MFYVNIPQVGPHIRCGAIAVVDPILMKVVDTFAVTNCQPSGLALGPREELAVGCSTANDTAATTLPTQIISAKNGTVLSTIDVGGSDEAWYNAGDGTYDLAARNNFGGPALGIVDAASRTLIETIETASNAHSVAADSMNNQILVPLTAGPTNSTCPDGCVAVYGR